MKIKQLKIINQDQSTEVADIGADAINVDYNETTVKAELDKLNNDNDTNKTNITNLQSKLNTTNSNLVLQTSRIDNLAHLEEGSTTGDAELIDARVGTDSINYTSVGEAIRSQIGILKNFIYEQGAYSYYNNIVIRITTGTSSVYKCIKVNVTNYTNLIVNTHADSTKPILLVDKNMNLLHTFATEGSNATKLQQITCDLSNYEGEIYLCVNTYYLSPYDIITIKGFNVATEITNIRNEINQESVEIENNYRNYVTEQLNSTNTIGIEAIKEKKHAEWTNYINFNSITDGYVDGTDNGKIKPARGERWNNTGKVYLKENVDYYYYGLFGGYYAFFDENNNFISGSGATSTLSSPFRIPTGATYGIFSFRGDVFEHLWINTENLKPETFTYILDAYSKKDMPIADINPCEYNGNEIEVFRKCLCIGDSFTEGGFNFDHDSGDRSEFKDYSYPTKLKMLSNLEVTNQGYGGITCQGWWRTYQNLDLSGHDCCIILLGINDCVNYGSFNEESVAALGNIISKVKNENNHIKIFISTIPLSPYYNTQAIRESGPIIKNYIESLNDPDLYIVDMMTYSHLNDSIAYEYGHPSALGYTLLAQEYYNYISWIINQNKEDFRFVQFIGTNLTHENLQ